MSERIIRIEGAERGVAEGMDAEMGETLRAADASETVLEATRRPAQRYPES